MAERKDRGDDEVDVERGGDEGVGTVEAGETTGDAKHGKGAEDDDDELRHIGTLDRRLKSRHVQFLALSGAIGTGLFVGSGQALSLAGPLSAFLCYAITGFNLYCVINSLGEMAAWLPVPGAVPVFAARYVDPALGFTLGWNYWYQFAIGVPIEVTVSVVVLEYWTGVGHAGVPQAVLVTVFLAPMVLVNCLPVRVYGEAEFFLGAVKLTTILGLIVLMFLIAVGASPSGEALGFRYWADPGPMLAYEELATGDLGRFLAFFKVFVQATFSYGGSEMVVVAAGETENPRRNIPKAIRRVFWRIAIFYVLAIFLVGLCTSSRDPKLLNAISSSAPGAGQSPFVIAIDNAGIKTLPHVINGVVLSSAWSAGNSFFYASTRVLYSAALDGRAPKILKWERFGVPYGCVAATAALGCLSYMSVSEASVPTFYYVSNLSAASTLLVWASVCCAYLRFYYALKRQGVPREAVPYRARGQPFLAYFAVCFCLVVLLFNGFDAFFPGRFGARTFVPPYVNVPIFAALFLGYKVAKRTRFVGLDEMDVWSGKAEIDRLEPTWPVVEPRNWLERVWFWIA